MRCLDAGLVLPAYDFALKCSHAFNILDARGAVSATDRVGVIRRVRELAVRCAKAYVASREAQGFPLLPKTAAPSLPSETGRKMAEFLFEILAEEIPAGILPAAREDLLARVSAAFARGAARRDALRLLHVAPARARRRGRGRPPARRRDRRHRAAGLGRLRRRRQPDEGRRSGSRRRRASPWRTSTSRSLPKGPYVVARKVTPGRPASEVIGEILPPLVEKMTFPRMMRWGDGTPQWIRPVHSVLALLDGLVIPMSLFGVESGRTTFGHRTLAPGRIVTMGVADWFQKLRAAHVEPDLAVRRAPLPEQAQALAAEVGGEPADDAALLDTWAHLVESPGVVRGSFDPAFLELPEEILVTSMREHQKMLPVRSGGALAAHFLAVCDQIGDPKGLIARGNEWVTDARFSDARFFWDDDGKTKLEDRLPRLGKLQFQETLGDYLQKTGRIQDLAEKLAARLGLSHLDAPPRARGAAHEGGPRHRHGARVSRPAGRRRRPLRAARGRARGGLAGAVRPVPAGLGRRRRAPRRRGRRRRRSPTGSTR